MELKCPHSGPNCLEQKCSGSISRGFIQVKEVKNPLKMMFDHHFCTGKCPKMRPQLGLSNSYVGDALSGTCQQESDY